MRFDKSEAWNKELLSKYAKKITSKNKNNSIENIICNSAQNGLIQQKDFFDRTIVNNENTENYYIIEQGDFVYNPRKSVTAPYGPVNVYEYENLGIVSPLYLCFKVDGIDKKFLNYYFKSSAWYKYIYENGDSGARHDRVSIKDDVFLAQPIIVPNLTTQNKVASFLSKIDERIETQSKIIEKLQSQMLAIYHQVFSQLKSEVLPLAKLCSLQKGTQVNGISLFENGPYYFMNGGIVPSGFYNEWNTETDTISISEGGNSCGYVQYNKERFWSGGHCYTLQNLNKVSVRYLYHFLKSHEKDIMRLRIGTGLPNIQKKDLEQFLIKVPSLLEQERLVQLLDSFELKIETEENLFKKYKEQKKFLLSNMFI